MKMIRLPAAVLLAGVGMINDGYAQLPTRDNYQNFLPRGGSIVSQTTATATFQLFGDPTAPGYWDASPRDGIDDRIAERLLELGEHFSPILRRNTESVPESFEEVVGDSMTIELDTWRTGIRLSSRAVRLGPTRGWTTTSAGDSEWEVQPAVDDTALLSLIRALDPRRSRTFVAQPVSRIDTVLFVDIPGTDEFSWRSAHGDEREKVPIAHMHPFIAETGSPESSNRYELILQYWFFYPYNDGGNNHEGDWEHINVSVTTTARARDGTNSTDRGLLTEADLRSLLSTDAPVPLDSLLVRNVVYYFHNNVMVLDYLAVRAGETLWHRADESDGSIHIWEDTRYMDAAVRRRIELADGRLSTHPIGYIGGNNKGTDELLQVVPRFFKSYNRDSHGTYPFPGIWREVGPLEATEKIFGDVVPPLRVDAEEDPTMAWYDLISDDRYLTFRRDDIVLLPDWERLEQVLREDAEARRRWAWFVLPVHMGFPATRSPGAGALKNVDLGNVAPMSPIYNSAWNRTAETDVYLRYEPTVLRVALAPISPLSSLQSGWGILNVPIALAAFLPGVNVAVTQLLPWVTGAMHVMGAPPAKTFYLGDLPNRFTSFGVGGFHQFGGTDFARLLPTDNSPAVASFLAEHAAEGVELGELAREPEWGTRGWFNLYYSRALSVENSLAYSAARLSYPIQDQSGEAVAIVTGQLYTRELTGGLTYRVPPLVSNVFAVYGRVGYAYTSYSLRDVRLNNEKVDGATMEGGHLPHPFNLRTWWPNSGYAGVGVELFSPTRSWFFKRVGYGVRLEATVLAHRLDAPAECEGCHVTAERGDVALTFILGW